MYTSIKKLYKRKVIILVTKMFLWVCGPDVITTVYHQENLENKKYSTISRKYCQKYSL